MKLYLRSGLLIAVLALVSATPAAAQSDDWKISIYPVLAWVPTSIDIDVNVPPIDGGSGEGPEFGGKILDSRLDGAFFGGLSAAKGIWRIDVDGLWAAVGGDRLDRPVLRVDVDAIYGHGSLGLKVAPDFYVTAGVRRMATKYDIELDGRQFERKPGLWDPLIGVGWHKGGDTVEWHATFEGGGFGVGSDVDISSSTPRSAWPRRPTALRRGARM